MKDSKFGKCHLCGNITRLTYEHVPPRKAFNQNAAFLYWGNQIIGRENFPWDFSGLKGKQQQRGIGWYTLCGKCNNDTGGWYASSFVDFIYKGYGALIGQGQITNRQWVKWTFRNIYPLRIIKQIITMFFSVNNPDLADVHSDLRDFILAKNEKGISNTKYRIYLYVLQGAFARYIGLCGIIKLKNTGNIIRVLSEFSAPPFGYVLEFDPKIQGTYCDITYFANNYNYNKKTTLSLDIPIYECNTVLPTDYRTKQEIMSDYIRNKLYELRNK